MYTENKNNTVFILLWAVMVLCPVIASAESFTITRGMEVDILKEKEIPFVHAELVIHYRETSPNPAVPYLTFLNIFDKDLINSDTTVLNILKRLGNDFQVEHRPDFILLKVNFLPQRINLFIRLLKTIFNYRPFLEIDINPATYIQRKRKIDTRERFQDSVANYWKYYFKKPGWKKMLAYQVAYHYLFPGSILGKTLITPSGLKAVKIEHLNNFYRRAYRLQHSQLFLKGKIDNPAVVYGSIERAFAARKVDLKPFKSDKIKAADQKTIIVFNVRTHELPVVFWFEPVNTSKRNLVPVMVLNSLLFGYPAGRIFISATRFMNMSGLRLATEMVSHKGMSVICNTIRVRYRDLEEFILLAEREQKKLDIKGVGRREFLDTVSYISGRLKVDTKNIANDIEMNIVDLPVVSPPPSFASLGKDSDGRLSPVIVIVGDIQVISRYLGRLKPRVQIIDFFKQ